MGISSYLLENSRNVLCSILAGVLFFSAWWIIFDVAATYPSSKDMKHAYHIVGLVGSFAFLMVNMVPNTAIYGDTTYSKGCCGVCMARTVLFLGFLFAFVTIIAASWILFQVYADPESTKPTWPGVGLFLQNILIFSASMVFKFGRVKEESYF